LLNYRNNNTVLATDGVFGTGTQTAVKTYQANNGLTADGVAGQNTLVKLVSGLTVQNRTNNMAGKAAQYLVSKFESLTVDGDFGAGSATAVKNFQSNMGVSADGAVGATTWQYLFGYTGTYPVQSGGGTTTTGFIRPVRATILAINSGREFGASRDASRDHAGIDFFVNNGNGTPVYASAAGKVLANYLFYAGTNAVEVQNTDGTILRYGEISSSLTVGTSVVKGQQIGTIIPNTETKGTMLHLEYYKGTASGGLTNTANTVYDFVPTRKYQRRRDLLDPTSFATLPIS